jgi:hypothetical protein
MDDAGIPEVVLAAWQRAVDHWDEPDRHQTFVGLVAQHNCFRWAAARYKEKGGEVAERQLERLRTAAFATLNATATARPAARKPYQITIAVLVALVVLALVGYLYAVSLRDRAPEPEPPQKPLSR